MPNIIVQDLKPLHDEVLIRVEKPERMTASRQLWIPDNAQRKDFELYQGTVLAVGPGRLNTKTGARKAVEVGAGDRVLFYWTAGEMDITALHSGGDELRLISEQSIQAVIG